MLEVFYETHFKEICMSLEWNIAKVCDMVGSRKERV